MNSQELENAVQDYLARGGQIDTPTRVWEPGGKHSWMSGFSCKSQQAKPLEPLPSLKRQRPDKTQKELAEEKRALREKAYEEKVFKLREMAAKGLNVRQATLLLGTQDYKGTRTLAERHGIIFKDGRVVEAAAFREKIRPQVLSMREQGLAWRTIANKLGTHQLVVQRAYKEASNETR